MKHLQANLSTYKHRTHPIPKLPSTPPTFSVVVYTYNPTLKTIKSSTISITEYREIRKPLKIPAKIQLFWFECLEPYKVISTDPLECWAAYFLQHPNQTNHPKYKQAICAYPEYFL